MDTGSIKTNFKLDNGWSSALSKLKSSLNKERDTGKPSCGFMNLTVLMLRKNLTLEEDVNFLFDTVFCYLRTFPKFLDCTSGYQKGYENS